MLANGEWQEVMWDYVRDLVDLKRVDYLLTQRRSGIIEILFVSIGSWCYRSLLVKR